MSNGKRHVAKELDENVSQRETALLDENAIAKIVVNAAYKVHTQLGPGLLESVYESILAHEIETAGLPVAKPGARACYLRRYPF